MPFDLKGRTLAITGAANVPISPIVRLALENGMNVALLSAFHGRAVDAIEKTIPEEYRSQVVGYAQNPQAQLAKNIAAAPELYSESTTQADVMGWIEERFGGIDVFVNGSGSAERCNMYETDKELWHHSNMTQESVFFNTMYALPYLEKSQCGRIINLVSCEGFGTGVMNNPSFAASRGAVIALTKDMARELAPKKITFNTVVHGYIPRIHDKALTDDEEAAIVRRTPLGRLCTFDDVAGIVNFLMTDEAEFITGACINVTGGFALD